MDATSYGLATAALGAGLGSARWRQALASLSPRGALAPCREALSLAMVACCGKSVASEAQQGTQWPRALRLFRQASLGFHLLHT